MTAEGARGTTPAGTALREVAWEGFVAGLIGYAAIVVLYAAGNLIGGQWIFHTPAVLGSAILGQPVAGEPGPAIGPAPIFVYNGLHLLAFLAVGFVCAWIVREIEVHPAEWYLALFAFLMIFVYGLVLVFAVAVPVLEAFPAGSVVWANLAAALAMGYYLARRHPDLLRTIEREGDPEAR